MRQAARHIQPLQTSDNNKVLHRSAVKRTPFFNSERSFFRPSAHIQPKLTVHAPDDIYEKEADAVADKVMRMSDPQVQRQEMEEEEEIEMKGQSPVVQRKCAECEQEEKEAFHTQFRHSLFSKTIQPRLEIGQPDDKYEREADEVARKITKQEFRPSLQKKEVYNHGTVDSPDMDPGSLGSGGNPLPDHVQAFFENNMGYDFSQVRIHTGEQAARKNEALNAYAFTYGNHIWLNRDQNVEPSFIMAHEMAHVVQQTNPVQLKRRKKNKGSAEITALSESDNIVQRFIYWNEYIGGRTNKRGQETHKELERAFESESGVQTEVFIPTGNSRGVGFGRDGRPDLYKSSNIIGVTFKQPATDSVKCAGGDPLGIPATLNSRKPDKKPNFSRSGRITHIDSAPSNITVGDIKPAETSIVESGKRQVDNYVGGLEFTRDQINCWSDANPFKGNSPHWNLSRPSKFNSNSLPIPDRYTPSGSGQLRQLGISDFNMVSDKANQKAKTEKVFSPRDLGIKIEGKLYAMHAGGGVVAYYYAPDDYKNLVDSLSLHPRSKEFQQYAEFSTFLQNKVVSPLYTAPKKGKAKVKSRPAKAWNQHYAGEGLQRSPKKIQMSRRARLEDNFRFRQWQKDRQKHQDNFRRKDKKTRDKLQFLELIYKTDKNLEKFGAKVPGGPLPDKKQFEFRLGKPDKGRAATKNITELYSWMDLWANPSMRYLGVLRNKFGGTFVRVANSVSRLRLKLQQRLEKARNKNEKKGNSFGAVAVRAFWRAGVKIGGLVFRNTVGLLTDSLEKGLTNVISKIIPVETEDLLRIVDEKFAPLKSVEKQLEALQRKMKAQIDAAIEDFDKEIEVFKSYAEKAEKYGKIIKWAMAALNCATPPGFGCLKILAKGLMAKMVDEILQWCWTEKEFTAIVLKTGWFDTLPSKIAGFTADKVEGLLPESILPVFDRTVFEERRRPSADEIPCGEQPTAEQMALQELEEELKSKLGEEGFALLLEAIEKYGVPPDQELTLDLIQEITDKIPEGVTVEQLRNYLASLPQPSHREGDKVDIAEFLDKVKTAREPEKWFYVAHPPSSGHTKFSTPDVKVTVSPAQACSHWSPIKEITVPAKVTKRVWVTSGDRKLFKIFYEARQKVDIGLSLHGEDQVIKKGAEFWGYRPDVCKK